MKFNVAVRISLSTVVFNLHYPFHLYLCDLRVAVLCVLCVLSFFRPQLTTARPPANSHTAAPLPALPPEAAGRKRIRYKCRSPSHTTHAAGRLSVPLLPDHATPAAACTCRPTSP